jgi:hypothetical protein
VAKCQRARDSPGDYNAPRRELLGVLMRFWLFTLLTAAALQLSAVSAGAAQFRCGFDDRIVGHNHSAVAATEEEARYLAWQNCRAHLGNGPTGYANYCDASYFHPWADEWRCEELPPEAP